MIGATALEHRFAVVTRNVGDFAGAGVILVDPFAEGGPVTAACDATLAKSWNPTLHPDSALPGSKPTIRPEPRARGETLADVAPYLIQVGGEVGDFRANRPPQPRL